MTPDPVGRSKGVTGDGCVAALLVGLWLLGGGASAQPPAGAGPPASGATASGSAAAPAWCAALPRPRYATLERVPVPSSWFEVYRVDPDVYAIYEPHQWEEVISYLVVGRTRALLFDTGMGMGDLRAVVRTLTRRPIEVLNSHTHHDHIGDNWQFDHVLGLDDAYTAAQARGLGHGAVAEEVSPASFCGALPPGFDSASYHVRPFRITGYVREGTTIDLGGRTLRVLRVPGHAPDALALVDEAHGVLFTGDTFYEGPIYVFGPGSDFPAYARSVERLAALAPRLRKVLPAHNLAVSDPSLLLRLRDATRAVASGHARGTRDGSVVTYPFDGFSLMVPADSAATGSAH